MSRVAALTALAAMSMALLLSPPRARADAGVTRADRPGEALHARLDLGASWGIGAQMYLGAQAHLLGQLVAWQGDEATGTFDVSLRAAYGDEAAFLAPWRGPEDRSELHRLQLQVGVGHAFHLLEDRALALGLQLLAGWNHYHQSTEIDWPDVGVNGRGTESWNAPVLSAEVTLAGRVAGPLGLQLSIGAPLPTASSYLITMVQVSAGVALTLF